MATLDDFLSSKGWRLVPLSEQTAEEAEAYPQDTTLLIGRNREVPDTCDLSWVDEDLVSQTLQRVAFDAALGELRGKTLDGQWFVHVTFSADNLPPLRGRVDSLLPPVSNGHEHLAGVWGAEPVG